MAVVLCCGVLLSGCVGGDILEEGGESVVSEVEETVEEQAVRLAKVLYEEKRSEGINFLDGPCLSNDLMDDWVADIAHDPRQPVDDLPENQCSEYGRSASHFVELDEDGELIRVR